MKKIISIFVLFCVIGLAPPAYPKVVQRLISDFVGEQLLDFYDFVDDFGKFFRGNNIGGQKRNYSLGILGGGEKGEIIEICFCPALGPPLNPKKPKERVISVCEISATFKNRAEIRNAARFAATAALMTIAIYENYQFLPSLDKP